MRLIDADEVNKTIDRFIGYLDEDMILRIKMKISKIPTVERPHGEWIYHKEWELDGECAFECSKCGMGTDTDYNFCPNCGASMSANDEQVTGKLNSEIERSKSEIVPDYRDGWRLREGEAE